MLLHTISHQVLRKIEELRTRNVTGEPFSIALDNTIQENLSHTISSVELKAHSKAAKAAKKKVDVASHFILRAAYCKTEDLRRWFLTQETFLFKYQLEKIADAERQGLQSFLDMNKLHFETVPDDEKKRLSPLLLSISSIDLKVNSAMDVANTTYFKIPFQDATDLVARRQCLVKGGFAYVPMRKIVSIITAKFRIALSKSLAQASRVFATVAADFAPVAPLLSSMNSQYTGKDYDDDAAQGLGGEYALTSGNIDEYSKSMPLCMRMLHQGLKDDHKLKHHGRFQYGLFLKGAGMTMEESMVFFQKEFTKIMTPEKFQKEYTYNIRHMYGKEGKRTSYSAHNCMKIIMGTPPNSGEHHGCPYRHYGDDHLSSVMGKLQIGSASDRNEIMTLKKKKHFNLACQKHFEVMHPNATAVKDLNLNGVGDHPNAWYAASVAYNAAKNDLENKNVPSNSPMNINTPEK
jgi:DNA primase large subunit